MQFACLFVWRGKRRGGRGKKTEERQRRGKRLDGRDEREESKERKVCRE